MNQAYWARNPQGPFATLIAVAATYCHPEAYDGAYADLMHAPGRRRLRTSKSVCSGRELGEALADPSRLPDNELSKAVEYDDGSSEAFLRRLWRDCTATSQPSPDHSR